MRYSLFAAVAPANGACSILFRVQCHRHQNDDTMARVHHPAMTLESGLNVHVDVVGKAGRGIARLRHGTMTRRTHKVQVVPGRHRTSAAADVRIYRAGLG
jgi:hypothetical protein